MTLSNRGGCSQLETAIGPRGSFCYEGHSAVWPTRVGQDASPGDRRPLGVRYDSSKKCRFTSGSIANLADCRGISIRLGRQNRFSAPSDRGGKAPTRTRLMQQIDVRKVASIAACAASLHRGLGRQPTQIVKRCQSKQTGSRVRRRRSCTQISDPQSRTVGRSPLQNCHARRHEAGHCEITRWRSRRERQANSSRFG